MECFRVEHTKLNNQKYTNVFHKNIRHGWLAASFMMATVILLTVNISKIPKTQKLNTTLEMTSLWQYCTTNNFCILAKMADQFGSVCNVCLVTLKEQWLSIHHNQTNIVKSEKRLLQNSHLHLLIMTCSGPKMKFDKALINWYIVNNSEYNHRHTDEELQKSRIFIFKNVNTDGLIWLKITLV